MKSHRRPSSASAPSSPSTAAPSTSSNATTGLSNAQAAQVAEEATRAPEVEVPHLAALEEQLGQDLSHVRAHQDDGSLQQLGAQALAFGDDIVIAEDAPREVVAEEVAHTIQQRSGTAPAGQSVEGDASEQAARAVARGGPTDLLGRAPASGTAAPSVQRRPAPDKTVSGTAMSRLSSAKMGIEHTKQVIHMGAGNQLDALKDTNFNSYFRMAAMRDPECWELDPSVYDLANSYPDALTAAKADLAAGGNCGEHAMVAFDYLRTQGGHTVNRCDKAGLDHAFVILGDIGTDSDEDLVVCDPWPTAPTACLWEDHFAYTSDPSKLNTRHSADAEDTEDIKAIIAKGLRLSAKGQEMIEYAFDEERTKEEIEKGQEGDKPWIWDHANAASTEYTYVEEKPPEVDLEQAPEQGQAASEEQPSEEEIAQAGGDSGWARFISWLRAFV